MIANQNLIVLIEPWQSVHLSAGSDDGLFTASSQRARSIEKKYEKKTEGCEQSRATKATKIHEILFVKSAFLSVRSRYAGRTSNLIL